MPFGVTGRTGPGMRQVAGFGNRSTGRGAFGGEFCHCNKRGLTFAATRSSSQITLGRLVYASHAALVFTFATCNCPFGDEISPDVWGSSGGG